MCDSCPNGGSKTAGKETGRHLWEEWGALWHLELISSLRISESRLRRTTQRILRILSSLTAPYQQRCSPPFPVCSLPGLRPPHCLLTHKLRVPSMPALRKFLLFCTGLIVVTLAIGIVGLLLDPSRAYLWTQSILWAFLGSVAIAPFLVFVPSPSSPSSSPESSSTPAFEPDPEGSEWPFEQEEEWPSYMKKTER